MKKLHIDIETYSSIDIRSSGAYKYCRSIDFEILLVAFAYGDEKVQIVDLASGESLPDSFIDSLQDPEVQKYAHNAVFERQCFNQFGIKTEANQWHCTQVKAAYCGLPLSLEKVSSALNLKEKGKLSTGKALIKYFCVPCKPTKVNGGRFRNNPEHDLEKWEEFREYCIRDVEAEREICKKLERYKIPAFERKNYILDQKINDRGVLIDTQMAKNATSINTKNTDLLISKAKELTNLENPNSPGQLKKWLSEATGKQITTLAKEELPALIESVKGNRAVLDVLEIRKKLSKSSIKKYNAMLNCICDDDRARGLFQFYGANRTGRWAGRLIQLQNLPRNKMKELDQARQVIRRNDYETADMMYGNISRVLSELIRTALIADQGKTFAVADFSAIEARVTAWFANEQWRMEVFKTHGKIYEASASMMFGIPIEEITKGSELRDKGKIAELALGYQGSVGALTKMGGESMGLSNTEMKDIVDKWRKTNKNIKDLWYEVEYCAKRAIKSRGKKIVSKDRKLAYHYDGNVLRIKLPSGRCLFYQQPKFIKNKFNSESIAYKGVNHMSKTGFVYIDTYGGKLVENIVQATSRDLLAFSMRSLDKRGFDLVMHVHDEAAAEVSIEESETKLKEMCYTMSVGPEWAQDLPLRAEGYLSEFYKKD